MQSQRIKPGAKNPFLHAALIEAAHRFDRRYVHALNFRGLCHKLAVMNILDHDQADEVFIAIVVVEGEAYQLLQAFQRGQIFQIETYSISRTLPYAVSRPSDTAPLSPK